MGRGIGTWDWGIKYGHGIGTWDWDMRLGHGIGNKGLRAQNRDMRAGRGSGAWSGGRNPAPEVTSIAP